MDVINSIKLTSGTIVKLPIFPAIHNDYYGEPNGYNYVKASRAYAVLVVTGGEAIEYQAYSNADLLELYNIFSGDVTYDSIEFRGSTSLLYSVAPIMRQWKESEQTWLLRYFPVDHVEGTKAVIVMRNDWGRGEYNKTYYYKFKILKNKGEVIKKIKLDKANRDIVDIVLRENLGVIVDVGKKNKYTYDIKINSLNLPIKVGDDVGDICVFENNKKLNCVNLTVNNNINKLSFFDLFIKCFSDIIVGEY